MLRKYIVVMLVVFFAEQAFAFETKAKWAILSDANTGAVLFSKNAHKKMPPSSMTKLMTIYIVFEKLNSGITKLDDKLLVSERAWRETGSRMFLLPNRMVSVEDLLRGAIVHSGNDASVALAEGLAGSEAAFVDRMNMKAKALGMNSTHFVNVTGLHHKNHYMSTADLLILSNQLIKEFPQYYQYFAEKDFTFNKIKQQNRNVLLFRNIGVDGLKTGHTDAGGYGISVSAAKGGRRLVTIVNGCNSEADRASEVQKILQYGFMNFTNVDVVKKNNSLVKVDVMSGSDSKVDLVAQEDIVVTVPVDYKNNIKSKIRYSSYIEAPVSSNNSFGVLEVDLGNGNKQEFKLYAANEVKSGGVLSNLWGKAKQSVLNFSFQKPEVKTQYRELT